MNREAQPWPSPGLKGEGPGLPKVDTCPRDALDRPKTDPQYARNSSGKGVGTLEHASLEKTQGVHTWPSKSRFALERNASLPQKSVDFSWVFDMAIARALLFAMAILRFVI